MALGEKEPLRQPETPTRVQSWVGGGDRQHARPGDDSVPQPPVRQGPSKGTPVHLRELCSQPRVDASEEACAESGLGGRRLPPRSPDTSLRTQLELVPGPLRSSVGPLPLRLRPLRPLTRLPAWLRKRCALSQSRPPGGTVQPGLPGHSGECDGRGGPSRAGPQDDSDASAERSQDHLIQKPALCI